MTRDPIRDAFDLLEPDAERPSAEFANELFDHLLEQTKEFRGRRVRRWARIPTPPVQVRKAILIAAALAIGAAVLIPLLPLRDNRVPGEQPSAPSQIALVGGSGGTDIVIVDASTGEELSRDTCRNCDPWAPAWSPDGSRIAFFGRSNTECSYDPSCTSTPTRQQGIYVSEPGGEPRQLTRCVTTCVDQPFAWSPDGTRIAYYDAALHPSTTRLVVLNVDGSGSTVVADYSGPSAIWPARPTWSPDGATIAYVRRDGAAAEVDAIDVRSGHTGTLRAFPGDIDSLTWSPDGARIALDLATSHGDSVVVMGADGSHPRSISLGPGSTGPGNPVWAPDGSSLAFIATPHYPSGYGVEIWTADADGSHRTRVYAQGCCMDGAGITWSPDGAMIGFVVTKLNDRLYVMDRDGSNLRQILKGGGVSPVWRPARSNTGGSDA